MTISSSFFPTASSAAVSAKWCCISANSSKKKKYLYRLGLLELPVLYTPVLSDVMPNQLGEAKSSGHKCYINIKEQTIINHFQEGKKKKDRIPGEIADYLTRLSSCNFYLIKRPTVLALWLQRAQDYKN